MPTAPFNSKADYGDGYILSIGGQTGATGTEDWIVIGEITETNLSGQKRSTVNPTNTQSGGRVEKAGTLLDYGQVKISYNVIDSDAGQVALNAAFLAGGLWDFKIQKRPNAKLTQTSGSMYAISGVITDGPSFDLDPTKLVVGSVTIDIDYMAETVGS
jgi:hypothetical protein